MRVAFVSIPGYPCAVEVSRSPSLAGRPMIVGDAEQPKRVLDCSLDARKLGVQPDMTLRKALALCPDANVLPPDPVLYRQIWESILDALNDVSPEVEDADWGRAYLNVAGLHLHYRDEAAIGEQLIESVQVASGLTACVGIADGKMFASSAATNAAPAGTKVISTGDEAAFLEDLPVELLPVGPEVVSRLRLLGLEQIGDVAGLSLPELQSQFGLGGKRLWELANGIDTEPLRPRPAVETLSDSFTFEAPVAGIDVMIAVAKQLLSRLRPALRGRAARELTLQAELTTSRGWERRLVFREAVSESERLDFVLRSTLQNAPPPQAVRSFLLRLGGLTAETGKQLTLGEHARQQRQLEECIRQLKARYGYSPIYRCVDVEPWSVIPEERQILVESDA